MVLLTSSCCCWSDPQGLHCLEHEGLSPKLESLFVPLMVFDHGTLVPLASSHFYLNGILDKFDVDIKITGVFLCVCFCVPLLHVHLSLIMVKSFEEHLYSICRIRCTHSRVIVLYAATSTLYHHMHPSLPSPFPPIHPPRPNPPHFLIPPSLPSHIHPLTPPLSSVCLTNAAVVKELEVFLQGQ